MNAKTPAQGLKILKELHSKQPYNQNITNKLINAYIRFGYHDIALEMISDIPNNKSDAESLTFKAWEAHKNGDIKTERKIWDDILEKQFFITVHSEINTLMLRSDKDINLKLTDIPLFCVERNEILRLPFLLDYYRELGVTQFIFVDNNSDDGSFEFLLEQEDCHVFWTPDSFQQSGHGFAWINELIEKYVLMNQWYLVIDADEFLVYPNSEVKKLPSLIKYLDSKQYEGLYSFVLDTFPLETSNATDTNCSKKDLIKESPYFINNYYFNYQPSCPYIATLGGLRGELGICFYLNVVPLMKYRGNHKLLSSRHSITPLKMSDISSTLIHIKYLGDFSLKAQTEVKRKQHSKSGVEYQRYSEIMTNNFQDIIDEYYLNNYVTKFHDSQQLVDLGLINCPEDWTRFIENKESTNEL